MEEILVPLDGSTLAESAIPLAVMLGKSSGARLRLVQAIWPPAAAPEAAFAMPEFEAVTSGYLYDQAEAIRQAHGLETVTLSKFGPPGDVILRLAESPDVSSIVMSTHGRSGLKRIVMGSIAELVLRHATVPVFLVPAAAVLPEVAQLRRIVVPLDGSDLAYAAIGPADDLAKRFDAEIILLQVGPQPRVLTDEAGRIVSTADQEAQRQSEEANRYLTSIRWRLASRGLRARTAYRIGDPAAEIVRLAGQEQADTIAMSTHGRSGLERIRYGSVAESVLHHSHVPVMTFGREAIRRLRSVVPMLAR